MTDPLDSLDLAISAARRERARLVGAVRQLYTYLADRRQTASGHEAAMIDLHLSSVRAELEGIVALPGTLQPAKMCGAPEEGAAGARVEGSGHRPLPTASTCKGGQPR